MQVVVFAFSCLLAGSVFAAENAPGVPISVLVTVEKKGENPAALSKENIAVQEDRESRTISEFRPAEGLPTQLLLLIDDSAGSAFDVQIQDIKKFIQALPPSVEVGVGYMRNGMAAMTSEFTPDHGKAAASVRIAEGPGGADVSPYDSLSDAIKKWPAREGMVRREVLMISSGIEGLGGGMPPDNPYVNAGIASALKANVTVYAIYNPSDGHLGHSFWRGTFGQNLLSQLTDETGGELYYLGTGAAVSFQPYFEDFLRRQNEQYILTFDARAEKKSGLQPIKIRASMKGVSLAAPEKVFVKASL